MNPRVLPEATDPVRSPWHALDAAEAVAAVASNLDDGLSVSEARDRRARVGPNALPEAQRRSLGSVFAGQFKSPLIYLLFLAAGIAVALGHRSDAAVIFVVVLLNAVIGTFQEGRAERSIDALRKLASHKARVVRGGQDLIVEAREVVPGDVLVLEAGDAVAADARLLHGAALQIAEAALTGESVPVTKDLLPLAPDTPLADRRNMVYAGTHVTAGRARW
jgi:Ca2+-transporting ATPase